MISTVTFTDRDGVISTATFTDLDGARTEVRMYRAGVRDPVRFEDRFATCLDRFAA